LLGDPSKLGSSSSSGDSSETALQDVIADGSADSWLPESASWIVPTRWFSSPIWERGIEFGINGSEGNAQAFSILAAGHFKRETDRSKLLLDVLYGKAQANSVLTQHYAFMNSRWDVNLGDSRWRIFNVARIEFDQFQAFDWRLSLSSGLGYDIIKADHTKLTGRFGAGGAREFGSSREEWVAEAVFGADFEHKFSDKQKIVFTSDYYPAWEEFSNYRLVTTGSWELLLDQATNLSLKIGFLDRYDSTSMGRQPNDIDYYVTLLWKL
jgi:putative salt-induced outer membrane protein YdiY